MAFHFFKPKWEHRDARVRLAAVRELNADEHGEILLRLAKKDSSADVRLAVVEHVDHKLLNQWAQDLNDWPSDSAIAVRRRLEEFFAHRVVHAENTEQRQEALAHIHHQPRLLQLFETIPNNEIRREILECITDEKTLCRAAEKCSKSLGKGLVERLNQPELLQHLALHAGNKSVRRYAKERLEVLEREQNKPSEEELREQALQELLQRLEKLSTSWNWDYAAKQIQALIARWTELDPGHQHPQWAAAAAAGDIFKQRQADFEQRRAEEERKAAERAAIAAERAALCEQVEICCGLKSINSDEYVQEAQQEWAKLPALSGELGEQLEERFQQALKTFERDKNRQIARRDRLEKQCAVLREACTRAEELAAGEVNKAAFNEAKALRRRFLKETPPPPAKPAESAVEPTETEAKKEAPRTVADEETPLTGLEAECEAIRTRLRLACEQIEAKSKAAQEAVQQQRQERIEKLEKICAQAEALAETENPAGEAERQMREIKADFRAVQDVPRSVHAAAKKRFRQACDRFYENLRQAREARDWETWANLNLQEALYRQAQELEAETDLPQLARTVRELQAKWKEIGPAPRNKKAQEVWEGFHQACDQAYARCKVFFEQQENERRENLVRKTALCKAAAELSDSSEWKETAEKIRKLQQQWQDIGHVPRENAEEINRRFRQACNRFFDRRRDYFKEEKERRAVNLTEKKKLAEQAESLRDDTDWGRTANRLKSLQKKWKELGPAPTREEDQAVWEQFHGACDAFFQRFDALRPENLRQKILLCEQVETLTQEAAKADARRQAEIAAALIELQKQWQKIGPVPQENQEEIWQRFHAPTDSFFSGRREERERNEVVKRSLLEEALSLSGSTEWRETTERLKELQAEWKRIGPATAEHESAMNREFHQACNAFFSRLKSRYAEQEENLRSRERICTRIEFLAGAQQESKSTAGDGGMSVAEQLQMAFESNFITRTDDEQRSRQLAMQEIKRLQQQWREIGPVPPRQADAIHQRYRRACDLFFGQGRPARQERERLQESPEEQAKNKQKKEAICEQAEALAAAPEAAENMDKIRNLQAQWRQIGHVPSKAEADALFRRFRAAGDVVYNASRGQ